LEKNLIDKVIFFILPKNEAEKRLLNRHQGRKDDNPHSIKKRFLGYQEKTLPIIEFLDNQGIEIIEIDASQSREMVHKEILEILEL